MISPLQRALIFTGIDQRRDKNPAPMYSCHMNSVAKIQAEIEKLTHGEQRELARWFAEMQADAWDAQIEDDVQAGRLDHLIVQAETDIAAGRTKPLDEVLDNG
jgi:hypothetical protein